MSSDVPIDRTKHKRVVLTVPHELVREVQDYRHARRFMTEAEAWRELVRMGLEKWRRDQERERQEKQ